MNYTRDNLAAAEDLTRRATELASDSARAWAARGYVQSSYLLRGWNTGEKRREDAQAYARRALALDANDTTAMLALIMNRRPFVSPHGLRHDPQWDKLRGQPAFEALLVAPQPK